MILGSKVTGLAIIRLSLARFMRVLCFAPPPLRSACRRDRRSGGITPLKFTVKYLCTRVGI